MKNLRHIVRVMRPPNPQGESGQTNGQPSVLYNELRCSIDEISGREAQRMMEMYATSTLKVGFWGDPDRKITTKDWLEFNGRRLNILQFTDFQQNGLTIEAICCEGEGA